MRFVVPQFIEVEDKIIGPVSVRQFVIFLVAFAIIFILYNIMSFIMFLFAGIFVFGLAGVTAFARVNGQPFHYFVLNILYTIRKPKLKVWNKEIVHDRSAKSHKKFIKTAVVAPPKKMATSSKLTRLSLVVDTGGAFKEEEESSFKV
ncbi:PrgI family protein [Patescibacteria group bacterium]|nr:PrgI family protein [Patescibacteria group bacterium]